MYLRTKKIMILQVEGRERKQGWETGTIVANAVQHEVTFMVMMGRMLC
jgi:hypothetical protein